MRSRREFLRLARTGDAQAQFDLACDYDAGRPTDARKAIYWYRQAAEQDHPDALCFLGEKLRDGDDVPKSLKRGFEFLYRAAQLGHSSAQVSVGYALFYGRGVDKDHREALK